MLSCFLAQMEADASQVSSLTFGPRRVLLRITSDQLRKLFFFSFFPCTFAASPVEIGGFIKSKVEVWELIWTGQTRTVSNVHFFYFG